MNMDGGRSIPRDAWSLKHGELPFVSHQVPHKSPLSRDATDATWSRRPFLRNFRERLTSSPITESSRCAQMNS